MLTNAVVIKKNNCRTRQIKRYTYLNIIFDYFIGHYIAQMLQNPTNIFLDIGRVNVNGFNSHKVVNVALVKRDVTIFMFLVGNMI